MAKLQIEIEVDDKGTAKIRQIGEATAALGRTTEQAGRTGSTGMAHLTGSFRTLLQVAGGVAAAQLGIQGISGALKTLGSVIIGTNATLDQATLKFQVLLGSADAAKAHVKDLFDFAAKTPFETGPILDASRQLLAAGVAADQVRDKLVLVGDAAAIAGAPINELAVWYARAYAAIQGGRPFGEASQRLQELAVLTPKARAVLEDLGKQMEKNGPTAELTAKSLGVLEGEFGRFSGSMALLSTQWEGLTSTIRDNASLAIAEGFRPFFDQIMAGLKRTADLVSGDTFRGWMREAGQDALALSNQIKDLGTTAMSALSVGIGQSVTGLQAFRVAMAAALTVSGGVLILFTTITTVAQQASLSISGLAEALLHLQKGDVTGALDALKARGNDILKLGQEWEQTFAQVGEDIQNALNPPTLPTMNEPVVKMRKAVAGLAGEARGLKKDIGETAAALSELEATADRLAPSLSLSGRASADFSADMTPLNVRLAEANTLFHDVRVGTKEYSLALADLSTPLVAVSEQTDGYLASTSAVADMLTRTDPVLKSLEQRLAEQITLFPKTRVQADAYLSTLADITTTTQETTKASASLKTVFSDVFDGITDILSLFGVKVGKVILMLQQLPRASGGIEKLAKGIGSVVGMIATPSSAVAALDWGGADGPISNIRQLGAASGDAAGDLGVFGGIVGVVSRLLGVFGQGLSAFGGKIGSLLTQMGVPGAAALGQAASGGIASFGIAQILGLGKGGQFASLGAGAIGSYFGGSGIGTVVGIAAGMVMESVQDFFKHPSFKNAIALGLNTVFPGIGTLAMKLFGGLFGPTPTGKLKAEIEPFNRSSLDDIVNQAGFGTAVGVARVNVGGNLMKSKKEQELQQQLADMLNELVQGVINTTVELIKMLPSQLGAQLDDALSALEATGLEIVDKKWKGGKAGKKLKKRIKGLADEAVQELFDALYGADLDLKALGGGERGDAAKGFDAVTAALGTMSAIIKETGISVDATAISLAEFTTKSVNYLQQFSRDGETFAETIQRVAEEFGQLFGVIDQLNVDISTSSQSGFEGLVDAYQQSVDRIQELADAGLVAIESGASPAEIAAAAQALRDAMDTSMQFLVAIQQRLQALNAAIVTGVDLYADIEVSIRALGGATMAVDELIDAAYRLAAATGNTGSQISIFESVLQVVGADFSTFTAALPRMAGAFSDLMAAIRSTVSNAEAITQLQSLAQAVGNGAQSAYQGIANGAARARDAAQSAADARIQALEDERRAIQDVAQEQEEANRAQLDALRQWQSIAQSAKAQLTDLFNLLAPTHPQTSFSEILAQFRSEVSGFGPGSTPGAATNIQELAQQVLQLAQGVPGMDLASGAFQSLAAEVKVALEAVQAVAANQPSEEELLGQIAQSGTDQSARLAGIDEAIRAEQDRLQSTLQSISAQEQQQIAYVNAQQVAALSEIRNHLGERLLALQAEQEAAREILQQITGELSFEQFIAQQQSKSVEMLGQIRDTLKTYLGNIIDGLGFDVPAMASGGIVTRPTLALIGERGPEAVVPLSQPYAGLASGQQVVTFAPGAVTVQVTGREHVGELTDKLDKAMVRLVKGPSQTHKALTDLAQRGGRR